MLIPSGKLAKMQLELLVLAPLSRFVGCFSLKKECKKKESLLFGILFDERKNPGLQIL